MTVEALKGIEGITSREAERSKNFFALGLMSWLYSRPTEGTVDVRREEVRQAAGDREANTRAFKAGYEYGETTEDFASATRSSRRSCRPASTGRSPATPRSPTG